MQVVFCPSFLRSLKKIGSVERADLLQTLTRYPHTRAVVRLDHFDGNEVLKCYLAKKRVRALVLLNKVKEKFVPVSVVKKESRRGRNISRETYVELFVQDISRVMREIEKGDFEVVDLEV